MTKKEKAKDKPKLEDLSIEEIREYLENNLPLMIAREDVKTKTGLFAKSTLANADCQGKGPKDPITVDDRTVAYLRPNLIDWIINKIQTARNKKGL